MVSYSIPLLLSIECAMAGPIEQLRRNDAACQPLPTRGGAGTITEPKNSIQMLRKVGENSIDGVVWH